MSAPKKAAKKAAVKHAGEDAGKDMRRAYEHLGRVEILHASLQKHAQAEVADLTKLAQEELSAGHMKDAADLLRSAEHLSFGALGTDEKAPKMEAVLVEAITKEYDHNIEKAEEHWSDEDEHNSTVERIDSAALGRAKDAFKAGVYRHALELARAAEALAQVHIPAEEKLDAGSKQHRLKS